MDKNLLLAVTLSLGVYAIWFGVIEKRVLPHPPRPGPISQTASPSAAQTAQEPSGAPTPTPTTTIDKESSLKGAESASFGTAKALISPRGAGIVSWRETEALGVVELIEDPRPGSFSSFPDLEFKRDAAEPGLVYRARRPDGVLVTKEFVPETGSALPRFKITLENKTLRPVDSGAWTISIGPGLGTIETEKAENLKVWRAVGLEAGKKKAEDLKPGQHAQSFSWVGVDNRYFLAAVAPAAGDFGRVDSSLEPVGAAQAPKIVLAARSVSLPPGSAKTWVVPYYLGAKGFRWLSHYGVDLDRAINFGVFHPIGRLVLRVLLRLHDWTGNFGWSIILLTILLQLMLFPLTLKSLKSMAAMRRLQPEIARLQQRYAKDQAKLSAETMELYKKEGANPLGGCLPMLVQMPVFYALYNALRNSWELHGAAWIFWVKDLSAKDPFYVLPLVMGGFMFVQNKLNAAQTSDPAQAQMMTWMPVIFTFMFLKFPAGLVLYWLTNSVVSTTQQLALKSYLDPKPAPRR